MPIREESFRIGCGRYIQGRGYIVKTGDEILRLGTSPLMIGGELTKFDDFTMSLLTNAELIEVLNNTHSAHPLFRKVVDGNEQIAWFASHNDGKSFYVALFNAGKKSCEITAALPFSANFTVTDVWSGKKIGKATDSVYAKVRSHGARLLKVTRA